MQILDSQGIEMTVKGLKVWEIRRNKIYTAPLKRASPNEKQKQIVYSHPKLFTSGITLMDVLNSIEILPTSFSNLRKLKDALALYD